MIPHKESDKFLLLPNDDDELINCGCCKKVLKDPRIGFPCGCTYSGHCKDSEACPICLRWVEYEVQNNAMAAIVDAVRVRCCNYYDDPTSGKVREPHEKCTWLLKPADKEAHEKTCSFAWKRCPHYGCDKVYLKREAEYHEKDCKHAEGICPTCEKDKNLDFCCGHRRVKCGFEDCDWFGFEEYAVAHRNSCLFKGYDQEKRTKDRVKRRFQEKYEKRKSLTQVSLFSFPKRLPRTMSSSSNTSSLSRQPSNEFDSSLNIAEPVFTTPRDSRKGFTPPSHSVYTLHEGVRTDTVVNEFPTPPPPQRRTGRQSHRSYSAVPEDIYKTSPEDRKSYSSRAASEEPSRKPSHRRLSSFSSIVESNNLHEAGRKATYQRSSSVQASSIYRGPRYNRRVSMSKARSEEPERIFASAEPMRNFRFNETYTGYSSPTESSENTSPPSTHKKQVPYSFNLRLMKFLRKDLATSSLEYRQDGSVDIQLLMNHPLFKRWNPTEEDFLSLAASSKRIFEIDRRKEATYMRAKYGHTFPVQLEWDYGSE